MANKVYPDAAAALDGLLRDGMTIMAGGFGLCGIPEKLILAIRDSGREGPDRRLEQCRHRRRRARPAARNPPDPQDDLVLCRREPAVRRSLSEGRTRARIQPARHARRAHPRRRRRHSGVFHQDRGRHAGRRGQGTARIRRRDLCHGARHRRRPVDRPRLEGRPRRQPRLPQDRAQLQPGHGDRRQGDGGRGRAPRRTRRDRPRPHPHAGHFRAAHRALPALREAHRAAHGRASATA